ncbi:MAG TPA: hypothetical protein PKN80_05190 [bacterium]|nr:hypothetical protein [bacterium]
MKFFKIILAGLFCLCLLPAPAAGAESRDPSIAAGQAALKQGMAAAGKKNWPLAVKHYTEAQRRLHLSPQVMYNLALAHAQAGNELLADVWFRAYLGAVPQAANADQVRTEISRLEQAADEKVQRLFKQAEDLAEALPLEANNQGRGRRAEAFKSIANIRIAVGDFKRAEEDLLKMNAYFSGKNVPDRYYPDANTRYADFAGTLAEAGDVEGARRLRGQLKNGDGLAMPILMALVEAGDLKEAKEFLEDEKETRFGVRLEPYETALRAFAEKGDLATAEKIIGAARNYSQDYPEYLHLELAHLLRDQGDLTGAQRYARLTDNYRTAIAIKSDIEESLRGLENSGVPVFQPYYAVETIADIVKTCLWLGETRKAEKALKIGDAWIAKNRRQLGGLGGDGKSVAEGYLRIGRAYLEVENGRGAEAIKLVQSISFPWEISEAAGEFIQQAYQIELKRDLANFAISRGKPAAAERIADSFAESRERIEFLRRVLALYDSKADRANTERLTKKLAGLLAEVQAGGWDPENPGREFVVNAWTDAAYALVWGVHPRTFRTSSMKILEWRGAPAIYNLPAYIAEIKKTSSPDAMPASFAESAKTIGKGLLRIRALDRIYR